MLLFNQVHVKKYVPRGYAKLGSIGPYFNQRATGTPGDIVTENGLFKIPLAATNEAEVNGAYMGDTGPFRLQDILQLTFVAAFSASSTHTEAVFGLVSTANDAKGSMAGILWCVSAAGVVTLQCRDGGNVSTLAIPTGITLSTTPREFNLNFRDGVVLADARLGGSHGGRRAIVPSVSDAAGMLQPVARGTVFDLGAITDRVQLIAQISKTSSTDTGYLKFAAAVEYRWQNPAS